MVSFYINGEPVEVQLEGEKTAGDVLRSFEMTCEENSAAVIGIRIDGRQVTAETFDAEAETPLGAGTKFEFTVVTEGSVHESFANLATLFNELADQMENVPAAIQNGKNAEVLSSIKQLADSISQFCHLAALASLFPDKFSETKIDGKDFREFFDGFSPVLLDFEQALKDNDTVMIGDLSEYEICPRLHSISRALSEIE